MWPRHPASFHPHHHCSKQRAFASQCSSHRSLEGSPRSSASPAVKLPEGYGNRESHRDCQTAKLQEVQAHCVTWLKIAAKCSSAPAPPQGSRCFHSRYRDPQRHVSQGRNSNPYLDHYAPYWRQPVRPSHFSAAVQGVGAREAAVTLFKGAFVAQAAE